MKNTILRILLSAILLALVAGIAVTLIGLFLGWETATQFSDGFFLAGVILISIGVISFQGYRQRTTDRLPLYIDLAKLSHLWDADTFRGKNIMIFFGICGLLLLGLSVLISLLF